MLSKCMKSSPHRDVSLTPLMRLFTKLFPQNDIQMTNKPKRRCEIFLFIIEQQNTNHYILTRITTMKKTDSAKY